MADEFIGNYRVIDKIGAGGMAKVYLAVHKDVPNLKVVLKILSDNRLIDRFRQEADKMALLDGHGNICQIKHFFNHGEELVIAMEYIHGETLDELIKNRGRLPVKEAVEIIIKVLDTLQFAHNKRIFHRDIKPSNIMIDKSGQIKIIDFGIAKAEDDPDLTMAGAACGTPAYMAPEQFTPSVRTNYTLVDVYAVGTTLFHLLTGELPFKGENQFVLRDSKLFTDPAKPRQFNPEIPKRLENIILKSLDKNYGERHQTADEFRQELLEFMGDSGFDTQHPTYAGMISENKVKDTPQTPKTPITPKPLSTRPKGRGPLFIGIAAVVLAVAVYFIFFMGKEELPAPDPPMLLSPVDNAAVESGRPGFSWSTNAGEGASYTIEIAGDSSFAAMIMNEKTAAGQYSAGSDLADGKYFWRVKAANSQGKAGDFSPARSFTIATAEVTPIEQGRVEISVAPSGNIYINNRLEAEGTSRHNISLQPGEYEIRVENENSREKQFSREIRVESGVTTPLRFTFTPLPVELSYGQVRVGTKPAAEAEVYINGEKQKLKTPNTYRLTEGDHSIRIVVEFGGRNIDQTETVTIKPNEIAKLIFDLEK